MYSGLSAAPHSEQNLLDPGCSTSHFRQTTIRGMFYSPEGAEVRHSECIFGSPLGASVIFTKAACLAVSEEPVGSPI